MGDWLESRRARLTATDVANVLGHGYGTPWETWAVKVGALEPADLSRNEAVYWGTQLEHVVVRECYLRSGRPALGMDQLRQHTRATIEEHTHDGATKYVAVHPDVPLLACTPDAAFAGWRPLPGYDGEQVECTGPGVMEAKTAGARTEDAWEHGVPLHYYIQVQVQLLVLGWQWGTVPVLIGGRDFRMYDVRRDDQWCQQALEYLLAWWEEHVVRGTQPPVSAADAPLLAKAYPEASKPEIVLPAEWAQVDAALQAAKAAQAAAKAEVEKLRAKLVAAIGHARGAAIDGTAVWYSFEQVRNGGYTVEPYEYRALERHEFKPRRTRR